MSISNSEAKKILTNADRSFTVNEEGILTDNYRRLAAQLNNRRASKLNRISVGRIVEDEEGNKKFNVVIQYLPSEREAVADRLLNQRSGFNKNDLISKVDHLRPSKSQSTESHEDANWFGVVITWQA